MDCEAQTRAGTPCSRPALRNSDPPRCIAHSPEEVKGALGFGAVAGYLGGRPRKPRATEIVAEAAAEHAEELIAAFRAAVASDQPAHQRAAAAQRWLRVAQQDAALEQREQAGRPALDRVLDAATYEETIALLATILAERSSRGLLPPAAAFAGDDGIARLRAEIERPAGRALPVVNGTTP